METLLDLDRLAGQLAAAIAFLIPGLNTTWMMERLAGRTTPAGTERLLKALSWSVLIYIVASPWLVGPVRRITATGLSRWDVLVLGLLLFVAVPALLAFLGAKLRTSVRVQGHLRKITNIHPAPTAWDFAFSPFRTGFVRAELKDGRVVGGRFAGSSFAAAYPEPQDIFLEEAWRLGADGSFVEPVDGSQGLLIRRDRIDVVEFLEGRTGNHGQAS
jgi:hypothetical protein